MKTLERPIVNVQSGSFQFDTFSTWLLKSAAQTRPTQMLHSTNKGLVNEGQYGSRNIAFPYFMRYAIDYVSDKAKVALILV